MTWYAEMLVWAALLILLWRATAYLAVVLERRKPLNERICDWLDLRARRAAAQAQAARSAVETYRLAMLQAAPEEPR